MLLFPKHGNEPTNGARYDRRMPKRGNRPAGSRQSVASDALARNLAALFQYAGDVGHLSDRATPVLLEDYIREKLKGAVSKNTTYRMLNGDLGVGVRKLELVARAFGLEAWNLLFPGFDPTHPPALITTDVEKRLYGDFKELQRRLRSAPDVEESEREGFREGSSDARDHASGKSGEGNDPKRGRGATKPAAGAGRRRGGSDDA
jgi:hypothetical protein